MGFSLLPKNPEFFVKFDEQADLIVEATLSFEELVTNLEDVPQKIEAINFIEKRGDQITHDIAVMVAEAFVTPIDREDIARLANVLDDILDFIQGAATRLSMFQITETNLGLVNLAKIMVESGKILREAITRMKNFEDVADLTKKMSELESQGDRINRQSIADLFTDAKDVSDVLELLKWKEIIEKAENAIDKFEDVLEMLESVIIKHA